jgi:hypothetical protein
MINSAQSNPVDTELQEWYKGNRIGKKTKKVKMRNNCANHQSEVGGKHCPEWERIVLKITLLF